MLNPKSAAGAMAKKFLNGQKNIDRIRNILSAHWSSAKKQLNMKIDKVHVVMRYNLQDSERCK